MPPFDPTKLADLAAGRVPDLASTLFKLGSDFGIGIKDLPGLIKGLGETAREVKELNREMPILAVIQGITALLDKKEDVLELVEVMKSGILPKTNSGLRIAGDGENGVGEASVD